VYGAFGAAIHELALESGANDNHHFLQNLRPPRLITVYRDLSAKTDNRFILV